MSRAVPDWFHNAVISGVQLLHALNLQGCPSAETVVLTAQAWIEALWGVPVAWEEAADAPRLAAAFLSVSREVERWPPPRAVINHLPPRPVVARLPAPGGALPSADVAARLHEARQHFSRKAHR